MSSSGVYIRPVVIASAVCDGWMDEAAEVRCTFAGSADGWQDTEALEAGWDCPDCGTEHKRSLHDMEACS